MKLIWEIMYDILKMWRKCSELKCDPNLMHFLLGWPTEFGDEFFCWHECAEMQMYFKIYL